MGCTMGGLRLRREFLGSTLHTVVRLVEALAVLVLGVIAFITYRELEAMRKLPVALPSYEFEATGTPPDHVQTRGTWIAEKGPPEQLQTTTIECRKAAMQCIESSAVIQFMGGHGLMEATQTTFAIESWDDKAIASKSVAGRCNERRLSMDLLEKRATLKISASRDEGKCAAAPEKILELVAGYKMKAKIAGSS